MNSSTEGAQRATRFLFDRDFAAPAAPPPKPVPTVTVEAHEAALRAAEKEAYRRGLEAGRHAQAESDARDLARALTGIERNLAAVLAGEQERSARIEREATVLALSLARKLAGTAIARSPLAELETLAAECFRELRGAPHLVVRVHADLVEAARERLDRIGAERGFTGRLVVLGDPDIPPGDARCEWADGGFVRDAGAVADAVGRAIDRYLALPPEQIAGVSR